jgi:hypothetical protein
VTSRLSEGGVAVGAALLRGGVPATGEDSAALLAVLTAGQGSRLSFWCEQGGRFGPAPAPSAVEFHDLALGLAAGDFNLDGQEDLAVVFRHRLLLYVRQGKTLVEGPSFGDLGLLAGAALVGDFNRDQRPDLLVLLENRKARLLLSKVTETKEVEAEPLPPAAGEAMKLTDQDRLPGQLEPKGTKGAEGAKGTR